MTTGEHMDQVTPEQAAGNAAHDADFAHDHDAAIANGHAVLNAVVRRTPVPAEPVADTENTDSYAHDAANAQKAPVSIHSAVADTEREKLAQMFTDMAARSPRVWVGAVPLTSHDCAIVAAALRTPVYADDTKRLDWLEARSVETGYTNDDDPHDVRSIHEIRGNRSDREWHEVGRGPTLREAIDAAIDTATTGEVQS
jgi:hypothetical protein